LGVHLQPWNQTTVIQMAHHILPMNNEISDCKVKLARHTFAFCDSAFIMNLCLEGQLWMWPTVEVLSPLLHKLQKKNYQKMA
jgi:hypothetical protein